MRRQLGYLVAAAMVIALAAWLVTGNRRREDAAPIESKIAGVYRIADARIGAPDALVEHPALVGRAFIVQRDGPELVAGLCPDVVTCRRWLETPTFRHALASLPVDIASLAEADVESVLSSAHVVGEPSANITTTQDGRCRRRIDGGSLTTTEIGLRLRRELAQTELVVDCEGQPADDRLLVELSLVRMHMD